MRSSLSLRLRSEGTELSGYEGHKRHRVIGNEQMQICYKCLEMFSEAFKTRFIASNMIQDAC